MFTVLAVVLSSSGAMKEASKGDGGRLVNWVLGIETLDGEVLDACLNHRKYKIPIVHIDLVFKQPRT